MGISPDASCSLGLMVLAGNLGHLSTEDERTGFEDTREHMSLSLGLGLSPGYATPHSPTPPDAVAVLLLLLLYVETT